MTARRGPKALLALALVALLAGTALPAGAVGTLDGESYGIAGKDKLKVKCQSGSASDSVDKETVLSFGDLDQTGGTDPDTFEFNAFGRDDDGGGSVDDDDLEGTYDQPDPSKLSFTFSYDADSLEDLEEFMEFSIELILEYAFGTSFTAETGSMSYVSRAKASKDLAKGSGSETIDWNGMVSSTFGPESCVAVLKSKYKGVRL